MRRNLTRARSGSLRRPLAGTLALGLAALPGCVPPFDELFLESKAVFRAFAPSTVQVGRPFVLAVDLDFGCSEFRNLAVVEDPAARTIRVDVMARRPKAGYGCPAMIVMVRHVTMAVASVAGAYTIDFQAFGGRRNLKVTAGDQPVPEWTPPPFIKSDSSTNL